ICRPQCMVHGFVREAMLLVPSARTSVEFGHLVGLPALQAMAQRFREELVIAIPEPLIIEWRGEHIGPLHLLYYAFPACFFTRLSRHCCPPLAKCALPGGTTSAPGEESTTEA